jgi:hypothetical protein
LAKQTISKNINNVLREAAVTSGKPRIALNDSEFGKY